MGLVTFFQDPHGRRMGIFWTNKKENKKVIIDNFTLILAWQIGIIGGSGMNDPDIFKERKEKRVSTPYGEVFNHDNAFIIFNIIK